MLIFFFFKFDFRMMIDFFMEFDSKSYLRALHLQRYDVRSVHHGIQITIGSQGREGRGMGWARGRREFEKNNL